MASHPIFTPIAWSDPKYLRFLKSKDFKKLKSFDFKNLRYLGSGQAMGVKISSKSPSLAIPSSRGGFQAAGRPAVGHWNADRKHPALTPRAGPGGQPGSSLSASSSSATSLSSSSSSSSAQEGAGS